MECEVGPQTKGSERVWYQSFVDPVDQSPYIARLQSTLDAIASESIKFEVHGLSPPDSHFHPLTEFRCAAQTIRLAIEAERLGYSAFVIGHFQEPGLRECRGSVDIPVIGLGEAALLSACTMGRKIALVTIDPAFIDWHERQIAELGLFSRIVGVRAIRTGLDDFMQAFTDRAAYARVRENFIEQVRPLVTAGADVIVPAGGLPMLLFCHERPFTIDGSLVLSGIPVVAKAAETALALHRLMGAVVSRRGAFAKASPEAIEEFMSRHW
ncbi:MAG TPA: aspartate/glutamate racemase family protein [Alphaproteobacteria bacterium]|nr:aspartate/glutamate racemase family protein [Alphaproteobacteria bacterium]